MEFSTSKRRAVESSPPLLLDSESEKTAVGAIERFSVRRCTISLVIRELIFGPGNESVILL